jgi:hypothetical protein
MSAREVPAMYLVTILADTSVDMLVRADELESVFDDALVAPASKGINGVVFRRFDPSRAYVGGRR